MFVFLFLISNICSLNSLSINFLKFQRLVVDKYFEVGGTKKFSKSLPACSLECLNEETCRSVGFHKIRKECYLYSFVLYDDLYYVPDIGFVTYINEDRPINYNIILKTGDVEDAGTNANIYVTIYGTLGNSTQMELDSAINDFERRLQTNYPKKMRDYGTIKNIVVENNYDGSSPDWFLEKVTIKKALSIEEVRSRTVNRTASGDVVNLPSYEIYHYNYNDWIATNRGDGSLVKTLVHDQKTYV